MMALVAGERGEAMISWWGRRGGEMNQMYHICLISLYALSLAFGRAMTRWDRWLVDGAAIYE